MTLRKRLIPQVFCSSHREGTAAYAVEGEET